jgi:hypothetical protein
MELLQALQNVHEKESPQDESAQARASAVRQDGSLVDQNEWPFCNSGQKVRC